MSVAKLNLNQNITLQICVDKEVVYSPSIYGFEVLDTAYNLVLNEGTDNEVSYSVGDGLTLTDTEDMKSITWTFDSAELQTGMNRGYLRSESKIAGTYLDIKIEITVE